MPEIKFQYCQNECNEIKLAMSFISGHSCKYYKDDELWWTYEGLTPLIFSILIVNNFCYVINCLNTNRVTIYSTNTAWKLSVFGVLLVRIFPHLGWIRTTKSPNTDTIHALEISWQSDFRSITDELFSL